MFLPLTPNWINVKNGPYNAKGDGVTDDTAAVVAAYNAVSSQGGTIYFPPGVYRFNLVVLKSNVRIFGESNVKSFVFPSTESSFVPANPALPLIQIGNDTVNVKGFRMENCNLYGSTNSNGLGPFGTVGIYFAGGAFENYLRGVNVWFFVTCLKFMAGATFPCTLIFISDFSLQSIPTVSAVDGVRGIYVQMPTNQLSFTTAISFSNGHISGPTFGTNSYAVEVDGTMISFNDVYFDLTGDRGVKLTKTNAGVLDPFLQCANVIFDPAPNTSVLVVAPTTQRDWSTWIRGSAKLSGKLKLSDATLIDPYGQFQLGFQSEVQSLQVTSELTFVSGSQTGYNNARRIFGTGTALRMENTGGDINVVPTGNLNVAQTGKATFTGTGMVEIVKTPAPALRIGIDTTVTGLFFNVYGASNSIIGSGGFFDGAAWQAKDTAASMFSLNGGGFNFYGDTGLVAGNTFSPTSRFALSTAGEAVLAGAITARNYVRPPAVLTYAATVNIDFNGSAVQLVILTGNVTFTTSNLLAGRSVKLIVICDGTPRNFTLPAWVINPAAPASIAANKQAFFELYSFSNTDAQVRGTYSVQT